MPFAAVDDKGGKAGGEWRAGAPPGGAAAGHGAGSHGLGLTGALREAKV